MADREQVSPRSHGQPALNFGKLAWGALLVLVGGLVLLHNLQAITIDFANLLLLWPLLVVFAGISMLAVSGRLATVAVGLLLIVMLGVIAWVMLGGELVADSTPHTVTAEIQRLSGEVRTADVTITGSAGEVSVGSSSQTPLVLVTAKSSTVQLKKQSTQREATQVVKLDMTAVEHWWHHGYRNEFDVSFSEALPTSVRMDMAASRVNADLTGLYLQRLAVSSGASDVTCRLGTKSPQTEVAIDAGMSSVRLLLPRTAGVGLHIDSGLSSQDMLGLRKVNEGYFASENYANSATKINIRSDIGMSNFSIGYY